MKLPPARLRAEFRQRRHHRAFRIAAPHDEPMFAELDRLLAVLAEPAERTAEPAGPAEPAGQPAEPDEKALSEAATNLWRAQRKLAQAEDGASRYAKQSARWLTMCRESLAGMGLVVQDHDGDPYGPGRRLEVLAFEEEPGADAERVLRTVRPSVYFRDRHIQTAQVIVGTPPAGEKRATTPEGDSHA